MNREILFKGKRLDNGEWVEGFYITTPLGAAIRVHEVHPHEKGDTHIEQTHSVDPATVGQFTGLLDKNGKRVWEGDVVEVVSYREFFSDGHKPMEAMRRFMTMEYRNGQLYMIEQLPEPLSETLWAVNSTIQDGSLEVTGNRWDGGHRDEAD